MIGLTASSTVSLALGEFCLKLSTLFVVCLLDCDDNRSLGTGMSSLILSLLRRHVDYL